MLHLHFIRKIDWLRYRMPTCLGFFYLGLWGSDLPVQESLPRLGWLLLIFAGSGSFVRYYNDLFDIEADRLSHKFNLAEKDPPYLRVLRPLLSSGLVFLPFFFFLQADVALLLMLFQHLLYLAYSTPPIRLKTRGLTGVIADALYGQTIPPLAAIAVAVAGGSRRPEMSMLLVTGLPLFISGWNNILFHQLEDRKGDRQSNLRTFTAAFGPLRVKRLALGWLIPLESASLLLWSFLWAGLSTPLVLAASFVSVLLLAGPVLRKGMVDRPALDRLPIQTIITLNPFYETVQPLSALLFLMLDDPWYGILALVHILLFPDTTSIRLQPFFLAMGRIIRAVYWRTEKALKDFYFHWLLVRYMEVKVVVMQTLIRLKNKSK